MARFSGLRLDIPHNDDPDPLAGAPYYVAADNPEIVLHGEVVLLSVRKRHDAPIAVLVPGQELDGVFARARDEREGRRRCHHPTG